jgi:WD40 repeat protein
MNLKSHVIGNCMKGIFVAVLLLSAVAGLLSITTAQTGEPSREPILRIETGMHTAVIRGIGVDAANRFLVTASDDKTVRVWELPSVRLLRVIRVPIGEAYEGRLYAIAMSPDGNMIATGGRTGYDWENAYSIYVFERDSGRLIRRLSGLPEQVAHLTYSPDGRYLAATLGGNDGIRVFSTTNYELIGQDKEYDGESDRADFARTGKLVTTSHDGFIRLYQVGEDVPFRLLTKRKVAGRGIPVAISFSPDGSKIATAFYDPSKEDAVDVLSASDLSPMYAPKTSGIKNGDVRTLDWSYDGNTLYAGGRIGRPTKYTLVHEPPTHNIRAWSNAGTGPYKDYPALARGEIMQVNALRNGDIVYGTSEPEIGMMDANGTRKLFIGSPIADYFPGVRPWSIGKLIAQKPHYILISSDGNSVWFPLEYSSMTGGATFSVKERRLDTSAPLDTAILKTMGLLRPKLEAKGLDITNWELKSGTKLNGKALPLSEMSRVLAIAPDEKQFLLGTQFYLRLFDKSGAELWHLAAPSATMSVNISGDGRIAVAAFADGTIRWYRMTDGKELLALFPHGDRRRWVALTPEGYYDCSPGAEDLIGWHVNNGKDQAADFYPIGQFFEKFYHPKLLAQVLTPDGVQPLSAGARNTVSITKELKRPPLVRITSPKAGATSEFDSTRIVVEATDQGGGVEDVRLYQNGKLVSDDTRQLARETSAQTKTFDVTLLPGVNTFRATAFNKDRTESNPAEIEIQLRAAEASSDLYILAIGLNEYRNTRYNLNYGRADAQAFADAVEQHGHGIFKEIKKRVIFDADATRANIEAAFNQIIKQARPQDAFVFYYAGHGVMSESDDKNPADFYLVPYEVVRIYGDDGSLTTNGIAARNLGELLKNVRAQKQLIILDACESGGAIETIAMRGASEEKAIMQLARSAGVAVLASAGQDQVATEFGKLGHGVFTYVLLKGLSGEADGAPRDGKITVKELEAYISDQVPELTKLYHGKRQDPNSWTRGQDFPIAIR